jgi:hypothetical protein
VSEVVERRLEFLKLEAKGFSLCETVKLLSEKYQTSERNIYYDAETRNTWQPVLTQLFDLDKARLIVMNRYDFLYRQASLHFQTATESQKPVYLSKMVEVALNMQASVSWMIFPKSLKPARLQRCFAASALPHRPIG